MKYEIFNGEYVGTAEWSEPGRVAIDVTDPTQRTWFERYFESEDSFLSGSVGFEEMTIERRDSSQEAFTRAAFGLAAYSYKVRDPDPGRGRDDRHVIDLNGAAMASQKGAPKT
ncbi:hypothetical protein BH24ACT26_BH24ACT26_01180 [soil metagenome]